jgi:hypothetical protein
LYIKSLFAKINLKNLNVMHIVPDLKTKIYIFIAQHFLRKKYKASFCKGFKLSWVFHGGGDIMHFSTNLLFWVILRVFTPSSPWKSPENSLRTISK